MDDKLFSGDHIYNVDCTGDCCIGDEVKFSQAQFSGSFKKPVFDGFKVIEAQIISDSYGQAKGQHTFTLILSDGAKMRIKGRNLYRNGTFRKLWKDETERLIVLRDKHERGERSRNYRNFEKSLYEI